MYRIVKEEITVVGLQARYLLAAAHTPTVE